MNLFSNLVNNIINNWNLLGNDFMGFSLNIHVITNFFVNFLLSLLFYLSLIIIFSFLFPFSVKKKYISLRNSFIKSIVHLKSNKFVFIWVVLFIILALINL